MCVCHVTAGIPQQPDQRPFISPFLAHHQPADSPRSSGSQGYSLLSNTPQQPQSGPSHSLSKAPVSAGLESSSAAGPSSMPSDAVVDTQPASAALSGATSGQGPIDSESALSAQAGDSEKQKKGHRRGRSLTGLIPTLKTKPKQSQSQLLEVTCHTLWPTPSPCPPPPYCRLHACVRSFQSYHASVDDARGHIC